MPSMDHRVAVEAVNKPDDGGTKLLKPEVEITD
jgi:hypothetical protein